MGGTKSTKAATLLRGAQVLVPVDGSGEVAPYDDMLFFTEGTTTVPPWFGFGDSCTGYNANCREYLREKGILHEVQGDLISYRNNVFKDDESGKKMAEGHVAAIDLTKYAATSDLTIKHLGYTAGPDLRSKKDSSGVLITPSLVEMTNFARKFRAGLEAMNQDRKRQGLPPIEKFAIPPFSSGVYKGDYYTEEEIAKAFWIGFSAQDQARGYSSIKQIFCDNDIWSKTLDEVTQEEIAVEAARKVVLLGVGGKLVEQSGIAASAVLEPPLEEESKFAAQESTDEAIDIGYAYTELEVEAVVEANDAKAGLGVHPLGFLTKNSETNLKDLTDADLPTDEEGKPHLVFRIPGVAYDQSSSIKTFFTPASASAKTLGDDIKATSAKFPGAPVVLTAPYKLEGWHWNALRISIKEQGGKVVIVAKSYDPYGKSEVPEAMQKEIRESLAVLYEGKEVDFRFEATNKTPVQEGVSCGVYAARMLVGMSSGERSDDSFHHEVFTSDGRKKTQEELRREDRENVKKFTPWNLDRFCKIDDKDFVDVRDEEIGGTIIEERKVALSGIMDQVFALEGGKMVPEVLRVISAASQKVEDRDKFRVIREGFRENGALRNIFIKSDKGESLKIEIAEINYLAVLIKEKLDAPTIPDESRRGAATAKPPVGSEKPASKESPKVATVAKKLATTPPTLPISSKPVAEKYNEAVQKLKTLGQDPIASIDKKAANEESARVLQEKIKNEFVVIQTSDNKDISVSSDKKSVEIKIIIPETKAKETAKFEVGEFCALSKDELDNDVAVIDKAHARQKLMDYYEDKTEKVKPPKEACKSYGYAKLVQLSRGLAVSVGGRE